MHELDSDAIRHALKVAQEKGFGYLKISVGDTKFRATFDNDSAKTVSSADELFSEAVIEELVPSLETELLVKSPVVGYLELDEQKIFEGEEINEGDTIGVVKALGLKNDVVSNFKGVVEAILVKSGEPVEYGQPILRLKK